MQEQPIETTPPPAPRPPAAMKRTRDKGGNDKGRKGGRGKSEGGLGRLIDAAMIRATDYCHY